MKDNIVCGQFSVDSLKSGGLLNYSIFLSYAALRRRSLYRKVVAKFLQVATDRYQ